MSQHDPAQDILDRIQAPNRLKATAWDIFYQNNSRDDLKGALDALPLDDATKSALMSAKYPDQGGPALRKGMTRGQEFVAAIEKGEREKAAAVAPYLSAIGGTAGMMLGGPLGAALGAGGGEAMRQLENRRLGADAPSTLLEAATDIGISGGVAGALGGIGRGAGAL